MKIGFKLNWIVCVFVIVLLSCESEKRPEDKEGNIPDVVSFTDHIIPIMEGRSDAKLIEGKTGRACTDCHDGGTPPDLTAENAYIELTSGGFVDIETPENSKVYKKMEIGGSMNQYTNTTDIAIVLKWIEQGALEN